MKKMKKLSAILLSLVIISVMCATAFTVDAAVDYSITINEAKAGETYTAYKMLKLSVNDETNPSAYRYTLNTDEGSNWTEFAKTAEFTNVFTTDEQGHISSTATSENEWVYDGKVSILAEKAGAFAEKEGMTPAGYVKIAEGQTTGKIELNEAGYYVITSTMGTRAMIVTTPDQKAVEIKEKNKEDSVQKLVRENSISTYGEKNDAQIGKTVEFKTVISVAPRSADVKLHDTMGSGLTFIPDSVQVYSTFTDSKKVVYPEDHYTVRYASSANGEPDPDDTFTIDFGDKLADTLTSINEYTVTYSANLNKNAVQQDADGVKKVDQINTTTVSYGDSQESVESKTTTTTHSAEVFKYYLDKTTDSANPTERGLAGSVFELHKGTDDKLIELVKLDDKNYRVADSTEASPETSTETSTEASTETSTEANKAQTHVDKDGETLIEVAAGTLVKDFVSIGDGEYVTIWGLDSDSDYKIREIRTPEGFNKLTADTPLIFDQATAEFALTKVLNQTGQELPSTGGIGTTIFYIVGGVLVLGAAVIFVVRRKMKKDEAA